jgi:uncharacterized surface protein with fasciclin (FAS1) repeats
MKKLALALMTLTFAVGACDQQASSAGGGSATSSARPPAPKPPVDPNNIVNIASGSKDHTTLVAALKAADYLTAVAASGPLTVFAPTNAAFDKLPKGTVESLTTPEKQAELKEILKYHVTTSVTTTDEMKDGDTLSMADGKKVTIHVKDGKVTVNDANILSSIRASNGIIHVIDTVLLPPK